MPNVSFYALLLVAVVAFAAPLLLGLSPARRVPAVVLETVAGIIIGPVGLGWVKVDVATWILSLLGLAFLLFLAGLEVELDRLKSRILLVVGASFLLSFGLALLAGYGLSIGGLVKSPLLVAILLCATSLGVVSPVLQDAGISESHFGQLVIAGATIAEFGPIILLSLFFSREATSTGTKFFLLGSFVFLAIVFALVVLGLERSTRFAPVLLKLQDTTAQIRVRGSFVLLVAFVALAQGLGLEVILGAFLAGVLLRLVDQDSMKTHPEFRQKLEAIGFGVFVPIFYVVTGIQLDLSALFARASTIALLPIFLVALLLVHGVPATLYRPRVGTRHFVVAGLLQAVSLPFIVAASQIGVELGLFSRAAGVSPRRTGTGPPSVVLLRGRCARPVREVA